MGEKFFSVFLLVIFGLISATRAADFSGKYQGEKISVELTADGSAYSGQIHMGSQQFPLKAHEQGDHLAGTFTSQGNDFDFTASKQGDELNLITSGTTYSLKKISPPVNPLAGATNPLTQQPASGGDAPPGYTVVTATDSGEALSIQKTDTQSVQAAFESTFPELAKYFDGKPTISGAFEDSKDKSGLASFTASHKGQAVKGIVSCKLGEKGAAVAVIYCKADAPASEWTKLTAAPSDAATTDPSGVKMQVYQFPDGTGSIGLADGWKTNAQTCMTTVLLQGPENQNVNIGINIALQTPESPIAQMIKQNQANARRMNMRPPPPAPFIVSEFLEPGDALKTLMPQLSAMSVRNGGPSVTVDKIISQEQAKENIPNGKAANICYEVTPHVQRQIRAAAKSGLHRERGDRANFVDDLFHRHFGADRNIRSRQAGHDGNARLAQGKCGRRSAKIAASDGCTNSPGATKSRQQQSAFPGFAESVGGRSSTGASGADGGIRAT